MSILPYKPCYLSHLPPCAYRLTAFYSCRKVGGLMIGSPLMKHLISRFSQSATISPFNIVGLVLGFCDECMSSLTSF